MDLRGRKSINKALFMWVAAALLLLIMATPALSTIFAAPGSVNTKAIINGAVKANKIANGAVKANKIANGAVKANKIANGAVDSAKIADGSITNVDIAAGAAIAASKINTTGLNADTVDSQHANAFVAKASPTWNAQTRRYSVPPAAWQSLTATDTVVRSPAAYATTEISMIAPVNLPDGAVVTQIDLYYDDTYSFWLLSNVGVGLYTRDAATFTESPVGDSVWSTGSAGRGSATVAVAPGVAVDNATNTYYLRADWSGSSKKVEMVIITYTIAAP